MNVDHIGYAVKILTHPDRFLKSSVMFLIRS